VFRIKWFGVASCDGGRVGTVRDGVMVGYGIMGGYRAHGDVGSF
jgi:hypothetical protein